MPSLGLHFPILTFPLLLLYPYPLSRPTFPFGSPTRHHSPSHSTSAHSLQLHLTTTLTPTASYILSSPCLRTDGHPSSLLVIFLQLLPSSIYSQRGSISSSAKQSCISFKFFIRIASFSPASFKLSLFEFFQGGVIKKE